MVLADPVGSILAPLVKTGKLIEAGSRGWWKASARISSRRTADLSLVKQAYSITDRESIDRRARTAAQGGHPGGSSSGTLLAAALRYCREQTEPKRVVTLRLRHRQQIPVQDVQRLLDGRQGLARARAARRPARPDHPPPSARAAMVTVGPDDTLLTAYTRMRDDDVSQCR